MTKIGACMLGDCPRVAVAISDGIPAKDVQSAIAGGIDVVELRVDTFSRCDSDYVVKEVSRLAGVPLLGTIRSAEECGAWKDTEEARLDLYRRIIPLVDAVDVELHSLEIRDEVIAAAREMGKTVLVSFHDFEETPPDEVLDELVDSAAGIGADILKIAAHCGTREDLKRLAAFLLRHESTPMIVVGMGPVGMMSRIFFPVLGSLLTYTFLGAPSAPGQLNSEETVKYLRFFNNPAE